MRMTSRPHPVRLCRYDHGSPRAAAGPGHCRSEIAWRLALTQRQPFPSRATASIQIGTDTAPNPPTDATSVQPKLRPGICSSLPMEIESGS
ncbi:unnamed protein product [Urochloa humidicola]